MEVSTFRYNGGPVGYYISGDTFVAKKSSHGFRLGRPHPVDNLVIELNVTAPYHRVDGKWIKCEPELGQAILAAMKPDNPLRDEYDQDINHRFLPDELESGSDEANALDRLASLSLWERICISRGYERALNFR